MSVEFGGAPVTSAAIAAALNGNTLVLAPAANASALTEAGYSLTGSSNASLESWAGTLNTSGVVDVLKYSITDTAHGAGSNFFNYLGGAAGATSLLAMDMSGNLSGSLDSDFFSTTTVKIGTSSGLRIGAANLVLGGASNVPALFEFSSSNKFVVLNSGLMGWSSTGATTSTLLRSGLDTAFGRNAAGVVEINNGTAGTFRDLIARNVRTNAGTVAGLVAAATAGAGARSFVTDATVATFGSAAVGGGTNKMPVWCDGVGWFIG